MAKELPAHLQLGKAAEARAARHLQESGLQLHQRNYRCPHGEIDLVMTETATGYLVFVEVRYRKNPAHGSPAETVDRRKQQKLIATAEHFRQHNGALGTRPCRFDVICLSGDPEQGPLQWLPNAF